MEYVRLGKTGLKVSRLCLGMMTYGSPQWRDWVLTEEQGRPFIKRALDLGINFYDTANMYSLGASEEILGRAVKDMARRDDLVIATKLFHPVESGPNNRGLSRKHVMQAIDASLQRLQMDYVDLYQIHRWDYDTPVEETMEALHDVVKAGKARYLGASSMFAWQFMKAQETARSNGWTPYVSMQNHYNLLYREEEREMIPMALDQGIGIIPWSPLARGRVAGSKSAGTARSQSDEQSRTYYATEADDRVVDRCAEVAKRLGVPPAQVGLAWLMSKPGVTAPIIGASKPHHLDDAIAALSLKLSTDDMRDLEEFYVPHPIMGHS